MDLKPQSTPNPTPEVPEFAEPVVREPLNLLPPLEELQDSQTKESVRAIAFPKPSPILL
jgi:TFIIF-interacting CTD phosphatase-like protein